MNRKVLLFTLTLAGMLFGIFCAGAQVSIGSTAKPADGALLQLKTSETTGDTQNTTKGLGMPRVALTDSASLYPMLSSVYDTTTQHKLHIGLTVYNVSTTSYFSKGVYVWNGSRWLSGTVTGTKAGQFQEWNGESWQLVTHDKINPIKRLEILLNDSMATGSKAFFGTIRYDVADIDPDDQFSIVSIIPVVQAGQEISNDPEYIPAHVTFSNSARRSLTTPTDVIWKLRITFDNIQKDKMIKVDRVLINYTSEGGVFTPLGDYTIIPYATQGM